ncbi:DUF2808 domain-containing protein [Halarchaeum sp. CBA1220]|uniref:DUF2808 domain-containing protein n=1 Tax=Halarchaeum sp. CBA1220 TaxID=1853682 RepID=UPI000F3A9141|nr:DUF2808 domain-containing protein [Halarchaeum sp. CBA1220]QLC34276.1 DUF2808 domain-containing protein [Halarchaeum sp. CBA1220]
MTRTSRAVALSAIVVLSVVASVGVGFVGTAAAADAATIEATPANATATATHNVSVSPDSNEAGSSLSSIQVQYPDSSADAGNVTGDDVEAAYVVRNGDRTNVTDDLQAVKHSDNGNTVTFTFGGSYDVKAGDTFYVTYSDVENPDSMGTYSVSVDLNSQSSGSPATDSLNITQAAATTSLTATPDWDGANATHTLSYAPGSAQDNRTLRNVTVDYGENAMLYDLPAENVTAFVDADADGENDSAESGLNVTGVTAANQNLTVAFNGSYTLNASEPVVVAYDPVGNPDVAGTYTERVTANGDWENATSVTLDVVVSSETSAASVTPYPPYAGARSTHVATGEVGSDDASDSLNEFRVDYAENTGATDVSEVGLSDVNAVGISTDGDRTIETNVSDDLSSVSISNDGHTLLLGFGGSYTLEQGDVVVANYSDVENPGSNGTYTAAVGINTQSDDADVAADFEVSTGPADATVTAANASEHANTTHTLAFRPGTSQYGANVTSLAANYTASGIGDVPADATVTGAFIDTDGDLANESGDPALNVTGVGVTDGVVNATFEGNHTVASDERVVLTYANVTNPGDGSYAIPSALNGEWANGTDATLTVTTDTEAVNASLTVDPDSPDATSTHTATVEVAPNDASDSLNSIEVDYAATETATDVSGVGTSDVVRVGISTDGDETIETNVSDDLSEVDVSNDGHTLTFGFGGSYSLAQGDVVVVEYHDAQNPVSESTYHAAIGVNVQSTDAPVTAAFDITASSSGDDSDTSDGSDTDDTDDTSDGSDNVDDTSDTAGATDGGSGDGGQSTTTTTSSTTTTTSDQTQNVTSTTTTATTTTTTATGTTSAGSLGFGFAAASVALAAGFLALRRRD